MMRHVPIIRPTTPKSPAFNDMEGSDEEDHVLQNDDEQNYIMNEQMGVDGDGERDGDEGSIENVDAILGDGMVRLACGNNLLRSEPNLLRQRLKVIEVMKIDTLTRNVYEELIFEHNTLSPS